MKVFPVAWLLISEFDVPIDWVHVLHSACVHLFHLQRQVRRGADGSHVYMKE